MNRGVVEASAIEDTPCLLEVFPFELLVTRSRQQSDTDRLRDRGAARPALAPQPTSGEIQLPSGRALLGLTPFQRSLLDALAEHFPDWITTATLAHRVGAGTTTQSVYNQIHQIRACLDSVEPGAANLIRSQRGRGYSLAPHPAG